MALEGTEYAPKVIEQHALKAYAEQPIVQADLFRIMAETARIEAWGERCMAWSKHFEAIAAQGVRLDASALPR